MISFVHQLLNIDEPQQDKTEESQVGEMYSSTTSLEEEYAAVLETLNKSSSKSSIKSKASKTSVKSKSCSRTSLRTTSQRVYTVYSSSVLQIKE